MKQTIEIEVPEGKKAVWKEGKVVFEDLEPKLPKTWGEFCEQNKVKDGECYISNISSVVEVLKGNCFHRRKIHDRNLLPNNKAAEQHLALMQLHQLRDCYRQGWVPDWKNSSKKYAITRVYNFIDYKIKLKIDEYIHTTLFLTFPTLEIAQEFLNNFRDLIEQAGDLV